MDPGKTVELELAETPGLEDMKITFHDFSSIFDMLVELDTGEKQGAHFLRVYSAALKAASPIWQTILGSDTPFGQLKERPTEDGRSLRVLHIDKVSIGAAEVFFDVVHHNIGKIPRGITFDQLIEVTKLVDQSGSVDTFMLWAECWIGTLNKDISIADDPRWFFIANVFRGNDDCKPICKAAFEKLCLNVTSEDPQNKFGQLTVLDPDCNPSLVDISLVPDWIIERIYSERTRILRMIINNIRPFAEGIMSFSNASQSKACTNDVCQYLTVGSFWRWMDENSMTCLYNTSTPLPKDMTITRISKAVSNMHLCTVGNSIAGVGGSRKASLLRPKLLHNSPFNTSSTDVRIFIDQDKHAKEPETCPNLQNVKKIQEEVKQLAEAVQDVPLQSDELDLDEETHGTDLSDLDLELITITGVRFSPSFDAMFELDTGQDGEVKQLYVCSDSLKATSKVWRKCLDPNSGFVPLEKRETICGEPVVVLHLDGVSLGSAYIFFDILHHNFSQLSREIDFEQLVEIAKLADEFDCANPFNVWVERWIDYLSQNPEGMKNPDWLFVADVFREVAQCQGIRETVSTRLCHHAIKVEGNALVVGPWYNSEKREADFDTTLIPSNYLLHISQKRTETLQKIIAKASIFVRNICSAKDKPKFKIRWLIGPRLCQNEICSHLGLGSIYRWLIENGITFLLEPQPSIPDNISVYRITAAILSLRVSTLTHNVSIATPQEGDEKHKCEVQTRSIKHFLALPFPEDNKDLASPDVRVSRDHRQESGEDVCPLVKTTNALQQEVLKIFHGVSGVPS